MRATPILAIALLGSVGGCAGNQSDSNGNVVEVVARGLTFEAPDTISSGWTTFRFRNESGLTHFAVVERLPDGIGIEEQQEVVAPLFQQGMDLLNAGQPDSAMQKFGELPAWFGDVVFMGGPGLTSAGHTSQASIYLEPGTYLLECYVKTNGVFHSFNPDTSVYGMVHEFTVSEATAAENPEPEATLSLTLSSERGIEMTGTPRAGENTAVVHFEDQQLYSNFVGHDVHVVRLADTTDVERVLAWMDWREKVGLETPTPAEFLGGLNEMPAGATGYFTITLEPGRYAWIAEVPDPREKGLFVEFSVP